MTSRTVGAVSRTKAGTPASFRVLVVSPDARRRAGWTSSWTRLCRAGIAVTVQDVRSLADVPADVVADPPAHPCLIVVDSALALPPSGWSPDDRIVMVGDPHSVDTVRAALEGGARGYLFAAARSDAAPASGIAETNGVALGRESERRHVCGVDGVEHCLGPAEIDILRWVADGECDADIGVALEISPEAVREHIARIGRRLGTGDRAHLVMLALRSRVLR